MQGILIIIVLILWYIGLVGLGHVWTISVLYPEVKDFAFWEKGGTMFALFMTAVSLGALTSMIYSIKTFFLSPNNKNKKYLIPVVVSVLPILLGFFGKFLPDNVFIVLRYIYLGLCAVFGILPTLFYGVFTFANMGKTVTGVITLIVIIGCGIWAHELFRNLIVGTVKSSENSFSKRNSKMESSDSSNFVSETESSFLQILRAADGGDADEQASVGYYYLQGNGVKKDYEQAFRYFKLAADQDRADAMESLIRRLRYSFPQRLIVVLWMHSLRWHNVITPVSVLKKIQKKPWNYIEKQLIRVTQKQRECLSRFLWEAIELKRIVSQ